MSSYFRTLFEEINFFFGDIEEINLFSIQMYKKYGATCDIGVVYTTDLCDNCEKHFLLVLIKEIAKDTTNKIIIYIFKSHCRTFMTILKNYSLNVFLTNKCIKFIILM